MAEENDKDMDCKNANSSEASSGKSIRNNPTSQVIKHLPSSAAMPHHRIPRPPNAFMIFANEHRKILAKKHPRESNKEISIRLGKMWRSLADDVKSKYHTQAKLMDLEHKKKYPDYVYNPRDARLRKEARRQRLLAGQHLARAMSHHIMVKQAKSTVIHQRMGMQLTQPIAVTYASNQASVQQQQMNNAARRVAIREQVLRGLGFQSSPLPGFQTLLPTQSMPAMHLLAPGNPGPNATVTSISPGTMDPNVSTYSRASHSLNHPQEQQSLQQQMQQQQLVQQQTSPNSDDSNVTNLISVQQSVELTSIVEDPSSVESMEITMGSGQNAVQKNPLLTLANEAVSQLTENYPNSRFITKSSMSECADGEAETSLQTAVDGLDQTSDMEDMQKSCATTNATMASSQRNDMMLDGVLSKEGNGGMSTSTGSEGDHMLDEKTPSKHPISPPWLSKSETRRPIPMYLVHPPTSPLMAMRPSVAACVPYPFNNANCTPGSHYQNAMKGFNEMPSRRYSDTNADMGTNFPSTTNSNGASQSPQSGYPGVMPRSKPPNLQPVQWGSPIEAPLIPANNMYATSPIPTYQNNIGGVMPWTSGRVFYVPMQEVTPLSYSGPYPYQPNSMSYTTVSFEQCYPKSMGDKMVGTDGILDKDPEMFASSPDQSSLQNGHEESYGAGTSETSTSDNKVFGQILSSTMQILNEEQDQEASKPLKPTCHVNYELVEQNSSPNRKLAELSPAEPISEAVNEAQTNQFTAVYY